MATAEKILLLENDPFLHTLINASISTHPDWKHCLVESYDSVRKALKELSIKDFELVLVDCQSFENSPIEILIQLRATRKHVPIIIMNRPGREKTAVACLKNGADYYLVKEADWEEEIPEIMNLVVDEFEHKQKLKRRIHQLEEENKKLKENAALDETTPFYTSNHFMSLLSRELHRANRYGLNLACLLLDVNTSRDIIKKIKSKPLNPIYEKLGLLLHSIVRASDIWARLNDNRFAALMPHTTARQAKTAIKRLDSEITGTKFLVGNIEVPIIAKWGLANFDKNKIKNENDLLSLAEASLEKR